MKDLRKGTIAPDFVPHSEEPQPLPGGEGYRGEGGRPRKPLTAVGDEGFGGTGKPPDEGAVRADNERESFQNSFILDLSLHTLDIEGFDMKIHRLDPPLKKPPILHKTRNAKFIVFGDKMFVFPTSKEHVEALKYVREGKPRMFEMARIVDLSGEVNCAGYIDASYTDGFGLHRAEERVIHGYSKGLSDNGSLTTEKSEEYKRTVLRERLRPYFTVE